MASLINAVTARTRGELRSLHIWSSLHRHMVVASRDSSEHGVVLDCSQDYGKYVPLNFALHAFYPVRIQAHFFLFTEKRK